MTEVKIRIKDSKGVITEVQISLADNIQTLKLRYAQTRQISQTENVIKLGHKGRMLKDDQSLESLKMKDNDLVMAVLTSV